MAQTGQSAAANKAGASTGKLPSNKKKTTGKTAADIAAQETSAAAQVPEGGSTGTSISGIPLGTQVMTGQTTSLPPQIVGQLPVGNAPVYSKVIYTTESPYKIPATMSNQQKADLLVALGLIPNLYPTGQAPTADFVKKMGNAVTLRPADYTALGTMMKQADQVGETYTQTITRFLQNPNLANQAFGKVTTAAKVIATTNPDALVSDMTTKYLDLFNIAPDKKTAIAYANEINKAEKAAGAKGFAFSAQEKEDIFLKYVQADANKRFAAAKLTPDTADDMALEQGALGAVVRQIRAAHADNGIPTSDKNIYAEALKGIRSQQALQTTLDNISLQATTQFPAFKEDILKGASVKTLLTPYISSYEKLYGKTPKITDLYDVAAGKTAIPVNEWVKTQWTKPDFKNTDYYKQTVNSDLRAMAQAFGVNV
jgi:hypothetical protein